MYIGLLSSGSSLTSSSAGCSTGDCKAFPTGSVLGGSCDVILREVVVGVDPLLGLTGERSPLSPWRSFPMGRLIQGIRVGGFFLVHAQDVAKELELA